MNASARSERLRNLTLYTWWRNRAPYKKEQLNEQSAEVVQNRRAGGMASFYLGKATETPACPCDPDVEFHYSLDEAVFLLLDAYFAYMSVNAGGPTRCARRNYLLMATLAQGWSWITGGSGGPTGEVDGWDWDTGTALGSETDRFVWMDVLLETVAPTFAPTFDASILAANERRALGWTLEQQTAERTRIQAAGTWSAWLAAWQFWLAGRNTDGSASVPGLTSPPNGSTALTVYAPQDFTDSGAFPQPRQWTPLKLTSSSSTQTYLTYGWKSVGSTGLSLGAEATVEDAANEAFLETSGARDTEIDAIVALTGALTDADKVAAEFWAGGPGTVTPPGMCLWFWRDYMETYNIAHTRSFAAFFYSGLDLAIHEFETSRLVWGLKAAHLEARPIQEIRRRYAAATLTSWDGSSISGALWTPYQETDFVTPPFADFPSGHSAFSCSMAITMTKWFGDALPTSAPRTRSAAYLSQLSPAFAGTSQTQGFATFVFPAGQSAIQPGVVPSNPQTLTWSSWSDMAEAAGYSRQQGGIHAASAHTGSVELANALHGALEAVWGIPAS